MGASCWEEMGVQGKRGTEKEIKREREGVRKDKEERKKRRKRDKEEESKKMPQ